MPTRGGVHQAPGCLTNQNQAASKAKGPVPDMPRGKSKSDNGEGSLQLPPPAPALGGKQAHPSLALPARKVGTADRGEMVPCQSRHLRKNVPCPLFTPGNPRGVPPRLDMSSATGPLETPAPRGQSPIPFLDQSGWGSWGRSCLCSTRVCLRQASTSCGAARGSLDWAPRTHRGRCPCP